MKFRKLLVANRGEIAVRVMRTCRELGIATAAVFSEADRAAYHVRYADEAYLVGPPPARQSYLDGDRLLAVAKAAGVDAIHPGYGFLSENAEFAQRCADVGIVFVGPPPSAILQMGTKTLARQTMLAAGVPVVPGDNGPDGKGFPTAAAALVSAERIGFPIMLKAAAGGGGKGMRRVDSAAAFTAAYEGAQRESKAAFGDDTVYLEKALVQPRHVEVQVFADTFGQTVHLFERDCSVQRRHQKVVEEAPSPAVAEPLRARLGEMAVRAAKAVGYVGAGTIETLLDASGEFYFLEMNTRLQVEHPITEWITGLDLVRLQLEVAQGERLDLGDDGPTRRGVAVECRVYAEDPFRMLPSPGKIVAFEPPGGPFVRCDTGIVAGSEIPPFYDPLLAKLAVWGRDRAAALARMERALGEFRIAGIQHNIPLLRRIVAHPAFRAGEYDTAFLERHKAEVTPAVAEVPGAGPTAAELALLGAALRLTRPSEGAATGGGPLGGSPAGGPLASGTEPSAWRRSG
jgi:acetyl-CoA carboxylase biotin carboxylase subunit